MSEPRSIRDEFGEADDAHHEIGHLLSWVHRQVYFTYREEMEEKGLLKWRMVDYLRRLLKADLARDDGIWTEKY